MGSAMLVFMYFIWARYITTIGIQVNSICGYDLEIVVTTGTNF